MFKDIGNSPQVQIESVVFMLSDQNNVEKEKQNWDLSASWFQNLQIDYNPNIIILAKRWICKPAAKKAQK